jgi:hypothetical protein
MLEDDRKKYNISDLGKAKISEEMKMLDEKRTKALQEKLRKKMLEKTLERQEELMAKKLLEKQTLNIDEANNINTLLKNRAGMKDGGPGIEALRKEAPEVVAKMGYNEGGSIDDQMMMVMTPPMESEMEPDGEMEDNYTRFIMEEALSEEEEDMLTSKLEQDEELSMLFDKIIDVAQEFAGSGPVEGPGSGVSDSIPARLSDGEFVFTAKAVEEIGEDTLMSMMKDAEAAADKRQGFAEGELVEEETVTMPVERQPIEQNIRVTKETVGPQAGMLEQDDLVDSEVKKSMFRQNRFL